MKKVDFLKVVSELGVFYKDSAMDIKIGNSFGKIYLSGAWFGSVLAPHIVKANLYAENDNLVLSFKFED